MSRQLIALVVITSAAISMAAEAEPARTSRLRFHHPVVIDAQDPPPGRRNFLWVAPVEFCWMSRGLVLVSIRGIKAEPIVDFWRQSPTPARDLSRPWKKHHGRDLA